MKIELLAPAGDMDSLKAAVAAGADAVYFGAKTFSARAFAGNFDDEGIRQAIDHAHVFGRKAYVAVNTLLKDVEFPKALRLAESLYALGADAVIVQDFALAQIIKRELPGMEVHASTQTTLHNTPSILFASQFDRIILPRELRREEIRQLAETGRKLEMFVHGALCFSFSGQCLMSSMIGGRSGNRGMCAQPCRKKYGDSYALSTADLCLVDRIPEIIGLGICALKIEGRMKSWQYVSEVVSVYRKAIDSHYAGDFQVSQEDRDRLHAAFNRTLTQGHYSASIVLATDDPGNRGLYLGMLENGRIKLGATLRLGDGVTIFGPGRKDGFSVKRMTVDGQERREAGSGETVIIGSSYEGRAYRTSREIRMPEIYLEADACLVAKLGQKAKLTIRARDAEASVESDVVARMPDKRPLSEEDARRLLQRKDGLISISRLDTEIDGDLFIPWSELTSMRVKAASALEQALAERHRRNHVKAALPPIISEEKAQKARLYVKAHDLEGIRQSDGADLLYYNIFSKDATEAARIARSMGKRFFLEIPAITYDWQMARIDDMIEKIVPDGLLLGNPCKLDFTGELHLKNSFNASNDWDLSYWRHRCVISPELSFSEMSRLKKRFIVMCHGSVVLMQSRQKLGQRTLDDGAERFRVRENPAGYSEILSPKPLGLLGLVRDCVKKGMTEFLLDLDSDVASTINLYRSILSGRDYKKPEKEFSLFHFRRPMP